MAVFTYIVTVRVINVLCSWRQGPASHTTQAWMWRLYITANPTSISAVHPVLSVPWAHPASQLQSAFLAMHNPRAFIWKKLPTNLVQLIFIAIGWPLTQVKAETRLCTDGHAFTVNIYIFSCYVYGNEANLHLLWGVSRAAPLSPWRRLPATDNVILNAFWCLHVSLECGEMKLLIHCKCFCLCFTEVLVFKTPSQPLETITWRGGTIASWVKHEWRIVQNLSDTLHTSFELPLAAASVHSPPVSSLQSALYSTVC